MAFTLLVLLIGGVFFGGAAYSALRQVGSAGKKGWVEFIGYALTAVGGLAFFATMFCGTGGNLVHLPSTFEWPVGSVRGVLVMPDGERVVPLEPAGRIQVYNSDWQFVRGWQVDAGGGTFMLRLNESNKIQVLTARRQNRYVYGLDGVLFSDETYAPQQYSDFYSPGKTVSVPTRWWLWILTSPFHGWIVAALGGGLLFLRARKSKNESA